MMMKTVPTDLPTYLCHKQVKALKLATIELHDGVFIATPADAELGYQPFEVNTEWVMARVNLAEQQTRGGYLVKYDDDYWSWSPVKAFEDGYTRIVS